MRFIINLTIVFDPENKLLLLKNNDELTVGLSKPAARLLTELIKNNKEVLTREVLIKRVWEDYGFSPSSATLSNHISELRKAFETAGGSKDVIMTISRIGFKMDAEIHPELKSIKKIDQPPSIDIDMREINLHTNKNDELKHVPLLSKKGPRNHVKLASLFILAISIVVIFVITLKSRNKEPALIFTQDKCNVYALNNEYGYINAQNKINNILDKEGIECSNINSDVYYMEYRARNEIGKMTFIAVCNIGKNGIYVSCNNYKSIE
ncbi:phosphate regulon transcriptional regulatory protein PhoB [Serratia fonticola]|jgi:DNA-binding winged helix-turn-helix (wHTH) protein|uniref:Phosphate regulon transcriptional regulatory protein PhoB n=1 Tax=Serratia fonticola TaxID=47917 RepID=A0A0F7H6Z2_SERFO|nr:winged helix-turn-helix domain-containing protein [Serratia fonticola]AKG68222.1 hypothetical protein WN53_03205 [Serratia fonticola]CAI1950757.1 phosphate regulon transcriptional regulatory protein PhoB [Serratia fonticola]VTR37079.1 phosphate regulon transcriptional regulatory protein PhoB [Serratia fonticola]